MHVTVCCESVCDLCHYVCSVHVLGFVFLRQPDQVFGLDQVITRSGLKDFIRLVIIMVGSSRIRLDRVFCSPLLLLQYGMYLQTSKLIREIILQLSQE